MHVRWTGPTSQKEYPAIRHYERLFFDAGTETGPYQAMTPQCLTLMQSVNLIPSPTDDPCRIAYPCHMRATLPGWFKAGSRVMVDQPASNVQTSAGQVRLGAEPSQRIDARALMAWRIECGIVSVVIVLFAAVASYVLWRLEVSSLIVAAVLGLAAILSVMLVWLVPAVRWRHWRYEVTEQDLHLQHGIITLTRTLVPMVRVQHVDTKQGPILRRYGLASVEVATAAGTQEIPALAVDVADGLRNRIAELAGVAEDV